MLDLARVAATAQREAGHAQIALAARLSKKVRRYMNELRAELEAPALAGRVRAGRPADLLTRARETRVNDPAFGRVPGAFVGGTDVVADVEWLLGYLHRLVEDKWPVLLAGAQRVRHRGTKATDRERNAAAAAVRQWILEHLGRYDDDDAVQALIFLGWNRLDHLTREQQVERVRGADRRHQGAPRARRHVGFSRRQA